MLCLALNYKHLLTKLERVSVLNHCVIDTLFFSHLLWLGLLDEDNFKNLSLFLSLSLLLSLSLSIYLSTYLSSLHCFEIFANELVSFDFLVIAVSEWPTQT